MKKSILIEVLTSLLILLFLYASFSKLFDFETFKRAMYNQPLPHWLAGLLVWALPPVEIAVAIALIPGSTRLTALYVFLLLMFSFTIYIVLGLLHFFPYVPCSCGGVIRSLSWPQHLYFNLFFILISIVVFILMKKQPSVTHQKQDTQPQKISTAWKGLKIFFARKQVNNGAVKSH